MMFEGLKKYDRMLQEAKQELKFRKEFVDELYPKFKLFCKKLTAAIELPKGFWPETFCHNGSLRFCLSVNYDKTYAIAISPKMFYNCPLQSRNAIMEFITDCVRMRLAK